MVSVPELIENGAEVLVKPFAATPTPVTPDGNATETSNCRLAILLGMVGLVTSIFGVPPLQIVGELLVGKFAAGVGSTTTLTVCVGPSAHDASFGVMVYTTV